MSLQTPRVLTKEDAALLIQATGGVPAPKPPRGPGPVNLARHETAAPLPCLCAKCLPSAPESFDVDGASYLRAKVEVKERVLWFWVPAVLKDDLPEVMKSVEHRLHGRLSLWKSSGGASKEEAPDDDDNIDDDDGE
jgi:hypothetical protein